MYVGVQIFTLAGAGYERGKWRCFIQVILGWVYCGPRHAAGGSGGGGSWRHR
jgi:hypothetical protein